MGRAQRNPSLESYYDMTVLKTTIDEDGGKKKRLTWADGTAIDYTYSDHDRTMGKK